jgi:hypothetical protein
LDGSLFDRIAKAVANVTPRREAVRTIAAGGLAAAAAKLGIAWTIADDKKKKKKKKKRRRRRKQKPQTPLTCLARREPCGGEAKCCDHESGLTACREFPTETCLTKSGFLCCGLEGAPCDNTVGINNCDCCDGLYCGGLAGQPGKCQEAPS